MAAPGTKPVYAITSTRRALPSGAAPHGLLSLLRQMLIEDLTLPANFIDPGWDAVSESYDRRGLVLGWRGKCLGPGRLQHAASGLGISLIPTRTGTLRPFLMRRVCDDVPELRYLSADVIARIAPCVWMRRWTRHPGAGASAMRIILRDRSI
ncbi:hypothetical protein [Sorlinia euscelidii]|uniref:hypothetical protein n=1 Tax=Sorlinia euscelidii TaxID=3081148 RepID=UPI003AAEB0B6